LKKLLKELIQNRLRKRKIFWLRLKICFKRTDGFDKEIGAMTKLPY